jgi:hypothetical protein
MIQIGLHGGGRMHVMTDGSVDVSAVTPDVLAFGLSHVTRFGGQAGAYSVAEHSVRMCDWARREGQDKTVLRACLLHDAPECLGEGDTQRFVKRFYGADGLKRFADSVCRALWVKHLQPDRPESQWTWPVAAATVKEYDEWVGSLEARVFGFPHDPIPDWLDIAATPEPEHLWTPYEARRQFLARWEESS